jgi:pimeloyl-ACP methyl ester carboxylesterase
VPLLSTPSAVLSYSRAGSGPPVLLIQGVGAVGNAWRPQIDALADRFTLIEFDNRGIGRSLARDGRITIEDMAGDALAIADAEGWDSFHVAGHSMGGVIAQAVALRAPARIRSLGFLCTFAAGRQGATPSLSMLLTALRMRVGTRPMRRKAFLELIMPASELARLDCAELAGRLQPLFGHDLADQPAVAMTQLRAMARYDARDRLGTLQQIPTLVLAATHDRIARPAFGIALAAAIPGSEYVELGDAGHGVTIHRSAEVNALLAGLWTRAEHARTAAAAP